MLDELIDKWVALKGQREKLSKQDAEIGRQIAALQADIMQTMAQIGTTKAASPAGHSVSMNKVTEPAIADWPAFYEYVAETRQFELLQKRLSAPAIRDRWDQGEAIPGVTSAEIFTISLARSRN